MPPPYPCFSGCKAGNLVRQRALSSHPTHTSISSSVEGRGGTARPRGPLPLCSTPPLAPQSAASGASAPPLRPHTLGAPERGAAWAFNGARRRRVHPAAQHKS